MSPCRKEPEAPGGTGKRGGLKEGNVRGMVSRELVVHYDRERAKGEECKDTAFFDTKGKGVS